MRRTERSLSAMFAASLVSLAAIPLAAHPGHGAKPAPPKPAPPRPAGGGQAVGVAQPGDIAPTARGSLANEPTRSRGGSWAVYASFTGPDAGAHVDVGWAPLSALEVGLRVGGGASSRDAEAMTGRVDIRAIQAGLYGRWLPLAAHTPYVEIGFGLSATEAEGRETNSLRFGQSVAYSRSQRTGRLTAAAGYTYRPGSGLVLSLGGGWRWPTGASQAAVKHGGDISDDDAARVRLAFDKASNTLFAAGPMLELAIGAAF